MEAIIWQHDSIDGVDHGQSCAAFASLTLELGAQVVGQQSWVTGGGSYPWPLHEWADVRVNPNPARRASPRSSQDAQAHHRWHPLGDGYQPQPGDWVLFDGHVEVVTELRRRRAAYDRRRLAAELLGQRPRVRRPARRPRAWSASSTTALCPPPPQIRQRPAPLPPRTPPQGRRYRPKGRRRYRAPWRLPGPAASPARPRPARPSRARRPHPAPASPVSPGRRAGPARPDRRVSPASPVRRVSLGSPASRGSPACPGGPARRPGSRLGQPDRLAHRGEADGAARSPAGSGAGVPGAYLSGAGAWTRTTMADTATIPGLPMMAHRLPGHAAAQPHGSPYRRHSPPQGALPARGTSASRRSSARSRQGRSPPSASTASRHR